MLDQWFKSLPKPVAVALLMGVGVLLIFLLRPPVGPCDQQKEIFLQELDGVFTPRKSKGAPMHSEFQRAFDVCRATNSIGGCYDFFSILRKLAQQAERSPSQCVSELLSGEELRKSLTTSAELLARLAWGEKAPLSYAERAGWLEASDVQVFCQLKKMATLAYGKDAWRSLREQIITKLPESSSLPPEEAAARSLFSMPCQTFL